MATRDYSGIPPIVTRRELPAYEASYGPESSRPFVLQYPEVLPVPVSPQGEGTAEPKPHPFQILDATDAGVEMFSVYPGYIEYIVGGLPTYLMPTLSGSPLTNDPPPVMVAVSGPVFLEITLDGDGLITTAIIKNAATLPDDTPSVKNVQLGVISVTPDLVEVTSQTITDNIPYVVIPSSSHPFKVVDLNDGTFGIRATTASYLHKSYLKASGMTISALNTPVAVTATLHLWIEVGISVGVSVVTATLKSGTAFPETHEQEEFPASSGIFRQTKYNVPVGRVVAGLQSGMPGFDFTIGTTPPVPYHWQQLLDTHLVMESYCFSGTPGFKAYPWQGI